MPTTNRVVWDAHPISSADAARSMAASIRRATEDVFAALLDAAEDPR